jgi:hypothetical protein
LAHRGLELAANLDSPEAALCLALLEPNDRVPNSFEHFKTAASKLDLDREWWALVFLEDVGGRPTVHDDLQTARLAELVEVANRVRAPSLLVAAEMALGHHAIEQHPDPSGALDHYRRALTMARDSGGTTSEGEALRAIAFAVAATDPTRGAVCCSEALRVLYDIRLWFRIWQMFDTVAYCLIHIERFEQAAVIVGFLETHHNDVSIEDHLGFRTSSRQAVRSRPELLPMVRIGARMNRHEVVSYALAALEPIHH